MTRPDLEALAASIERPDEEAKQAARQTLEGQAERGRLTDLAVWLAAVQGTHPARPLDRVRLLVAGRPAEGALGLADGLGVTVEAVPTPGPDSETAVRAGMAAVDAAVDVGTDLLVLAVGDPAPPEDDDPAAAALVGVLTRHDASVVTRRGAVVDDAAWMRRCALVRDAMRSARPALGDQVALLDALGGGALATATGALLQAAARRTPVLLDGVATAAAGLVAQRAAFRAVDWWVAAHRSPEPAHDLALDRLGLQPLLDLSIRAEDGTAALLAVPLLRAAAAPR